MCAESSRAWLLQKVQKAIRNLKSGNLAERAVERAWDILSNPAAQGEVIALRRWLRRPHHVIVVVPAPNTIVSHETRLSRRQTLSLWAQHLSYIHRALSEHAGARQSSSSSDASESPRARLCKRSRDGGGESVCGAK